MTLGDKHFVSLLRMPANANPGSKFQTIPDTIFDEQDTLFHFVLTAQDAERHILSKRDQIAEKLAEYGLVSGYQIQAAFDEALISYQLGLLQIICVDIGSHAFNEDRVTSLSQELGKLLSPFPGLLLMSETTYATPVYNHKGEIRQVDEIIRERAKQYSLSDIRHDAESLIHSIVHCMHRATSDMGDEGQVCGSSSAQHGYGDVINVERELSRTSEVRRKVHSLGSHGVCNRSKTTNGTEHPKPSTPGIEDDTQGKISWNISTFIYNDIIRPAAVNNNTYGQELSIMGTVKHVGKSNAFPPPPTTYFERLVFKTTWNAVNSPHYKPAFARVQVNTNWENTNVTIRSPGSTTELEERTAGPIATPRRLNLSILGEHSMRYLSGIDAKEGRGVVSWVLHVDDDKVSSSGLHLDAEDARLPKVGFEFHGRDHPPKVEIRLESCWNLESYETPSLPFRNVDAQYE